MASNRLCTFGLHFRPNLEHNTKTEQDVTSSDQTKGGSGSDVLLPKKKNVGNGKKWPRLLIEDAPREVKAKIFVLTSKEHLPGLITQITMLSHQRPVLASVV